MKILMIRDTFIGGTVAEIGDTPIVSKKDAADLVAMKKAVYIVKPKSKAKPKPRGRGKAKDPEPDPDDDDTTTDDDDDSDTDTTDGDPAGEGSEED